jgi:Tfp pilus assembly protein PilN
MVTSTFWIYLGAILVSLLTSGYLYVRYLQRQGEKALSETLLLQAELHTAEQRMRLEQLEKEEKDLEARRKEAAKRFRDAVSNSPPASEWRPSEE